MERLRERMAGKPFAVLAVNVDEPEQRLRNFLKTTPYGFQIVLDPGMHATKAWNARILPASFVIGRDGRIRYSATGDVDWSGERVFSLIAALLREP